MTCERHVGTTSGRTCGGEGNNSGGVEDIKPQTNNPGGIMLSGEKNEKQITLIITFKILKKMKKETKYVAPEAEILSAQVEKGFANSIPNAGEDEPME